MLDSLGQGGKVVIEVVLVLVTRLVVMIPKPNPMRYYPIYLCVLSMIPIINQINLQIIQYKITCATITHPVISIQQTSYNLHIVNS